MINHVVCNWQPKHDGFWKHTSSKPCQTQIKASRVSRLQIILNQSRTCDEITCKVLSSPKSNHETHSTRFMQSWKVKQNQDHAITKHQSCNHAESSETKIMQSQNINHAIMQRQTKQRSCNHKTSVMFLFACFQCLFACFMFMFASFEFLFACFMVLFACLQCFFCRFHVFVYMFSVFVSTFHVFVCMFSCCCLHVSYVSLHDFMLFGSRLYVFKVDDDDMYK